VHSGNFIADGLKQQSSFLNQALLLLQKRLQLVHHALDVNLQLLDRRAQLGKVVPVAALQLPDRRIQLGN
jgi:hypothetical protein